MLKNFLYDHLEIFIKKFIKKVSKNYSISKDDLYKHFEHSMMKGESKIDNLIIGPNPNKVYDKCYIWDVLYDSIEDGTIDKKLIKCNKKNLLEVQTILKRKGYIISIEYLKKCISGYKSVLNKVEYNPYSGVENEVKKYFISTKWCYMENYKGIKGFMYKDVLEKLIKRKIKKEYKDGIDVTLKVKNKKDDNGKIIKEKLYLSFTLDSSEEIHKLDNLNLV